MKGAGLNVYSIQAGRIVLVRIVSKNRVNDENHLDALCENWQKKNVVLHQSIEFSLFGGSSY